MATYLCAVCGTLALPTNSNLIDGDRFVHRGCDPASQAPPRPGVTCHAFFCVDDLCRGECWPEPTVIVDVDPPDLEPPEHWSGADTRAEYAGER